MKKTMLVVVFLMSIMLSYGQTTMKTIQKKDSTIKIVKAMQPEKVADKIITLDSASKAKDIVITDCSKEVNHYADSIKAIWVKHNSEVTLARQVWFWGEDKSNPGHPIDWFLYLMAEVVTLLAWFVSVFIIVSKAIKANTTITLTKFNFTYWWTNNKMQIFEAIAILIFIFFMCRLSNEYFSQSLNFLYAVGLGAGLPQYIALWKAKNQKKMDDYNKTLTVPTEQTKPV